MLVLLAILVVGAVVGLKSLLAPLPGTNPKAGATAGCVTTSVRKGQRVMASQVQVSVFNAGTRAGLADETMTSLTKRGFRKGSVGNAPTGTKVKVAQVWTTQRGDTAALLVAHQLGPKIKVFVKRASLGPGVDVVLGDGFHKLAKAKRVIVARRSSSVCVARPGRGR
jgi:hypothetical protein